MSLHGSSDDLPAGQSLRAARQEVGISLDLMSRLVSSSKSHLGNVETGARAVTEDIVTMYEHVLGPIGDDMWRRRNITHPRVMQEKKHGLVGLIQSVNAGEPGALLDTPTSLAADELVATKASDEGAKNLRSWMKSGKTSTLRVNALSILARRSERDDVPGIIEALETDEKVRELSLASSVSRLMQYDWPTCKGIAKDPSTAPDPVKLAQRLAHDVVDTKHAEARWCAAHLLSGLAPVLAR